MNLSMKWFDDISPTDSYNPSPSEGSTYLRSYRFMAGSRKRNNLRVTPFCPPKKTTLDYLVVIKGNCAPPTPIIKNNMARAQIVKGEEMSSYFNLLEEDKIIKKFLDADMCYIFADKYLLTIVFAHFKRCNFSVKEYTRTNFFICLYLAHDVEEDNEDLKYEIFPWVLGPNWRNNLSHFLQKKDKIWARMNYRAVVSKKCCEELMSICPHHVIWQRERLPHHGGAVRSYKKDTKLSIPRGPNLTPKTCQKCHPDKSFSELSTSYYDSAFSSLWECDSFNDSDEIDDILLLPKQSIKLYDNYNSKGNFEFNERSED